MAILESATISNLAKQGFRETLAQVIHEDVQVVPTRRLLVLCGRRPHGAAFGSCGGRSHPQTRTGDPADHPLAERRPGRVVEDAGVRKVPADVERPAIAGRLGLPVCILVNNPG